MNNGTNYFSSDYVSARGRFRKAVATCGGRLDSLELTAKGPAGEDLTIDIGWFGASSPRRVLAHSSGLHGVEAFTGSAIQLQWLAEGIRPLPEDAAIAMIHVLNPYGMAWLCRVNENNVDLNRNFLALHETFAGGPSAYEKLDGFLNPPSPPSHDLFYLRGAALLAQYGMKSLRAAIASGQYAYPKGLFFGGERLEQGPAMFQDYIADRLADVERIVAVDIHTGLGRFGEDQLLVDSAPGKMGVCNAMRAVFGERVQLLDETAYPVRGAQHSLYARLFPKSEIYFAAQEFGTYHSLRVLEALRAENRWRHHGAGTIEHRTKTKLRTMFNPENSNWRRKVLRRGQEVISQSLTLAFMRRVGLTSP